MKSFSEIMERRTKPPNVLEKGSTDSKEKAGAKLGGSFLIHKSNDEKMLAFGWANVAIKANGQQVTDLQEDIIDPEALEDAAYHFVEFYREGGEMHERGDCAVLVESIVFTKEKMSVMGIPDNILPEGWWIGFRVTDTEVWNKVKSGEYSMFSIEGEAERVEVVES